MFVLPNTNFTLTCKKVKNNQWNSYGEIFSDYKL